jgi:hypothetical protein
MLDKLAEALLPSLLVRTHERQEPGQNGAAEGTSLSERVSDETGAPPGHDTRGEHPVFHIQEVPAMVGSFDVNAFYRDLLYAIEVHALRGGTGFGTAAVVKRVALEYGLAVADHVPLPRPTREERAQLAWNRKGGHK